MRILGLDIGSTSIKAVEIDTAFGRFDVHEYHELAIAPGVAPMEAAGSLIASLPKAPDKVVTTLRSNRVTLRNLTLPTRDKRAIQASVGFELEDDLPFELDEATYDYAILGHNGPESQVHVAATLTRNVAESIALMNSHGVDPDVLTTEASSYRALLHKIMPQDASLERPVMLLSLGHEHSTIYVHWKGAPILCRDIAWGGREITLALSRKYGISVDAAEKTKMDNGFVLPASRLDSVSPEQRAFAVAVHESLAELLRDVKQADLSCKSLTQERVGSIVLAGGTSLLPGLAGALAEELKVPVQPLRAMSSLGGSGVTYSDQTDAKFALAAGAALALLSSERPLTSNFRRGQFSKSGKSAEIDLSLLKRPLITLSVAAAIILVILGIESKLYESKLADANAQLESTVRSFFGGLSSSALRTYIANTSSLKRNIDAELNKERELVKLLSPNPNSPFEYLKDLSSTVPRDLVTDLIHYQVGSSAGAPFASPETSEPAVSLTFTVTNPQVGERLAGLLGSRIKDMKRSEVKEIKAQDGSKRLQMTFSGKLQEGAANGR